jgi:hypothetical protein
MPFIDRGTHSIHSTIAPLGRMGERGRGWEEDVFGPVDGKRAEEWAAAAADEAAARAPRRAEASGERGGGTGEGERGGRGEGAKGAKGGEGEKTRKRSEWERLLAPQHVGEERSLYRAYWGAKQAVVLLPMFTFWEFGTQLTQQLPSAAGGVLRVFQQASLAAAQGRWLPFFVVCSQFYAIEFVARLVLLSIVLRNAALPAPAREGAGAEPRPPVAEQQPGEELERVRGLSSAAAQAYRAVRGVQAGATETTAETVPTTQKLPNLLLDRETAHEVQERLALISVAPRTRGQTQGQGQGSKGWEKVRGLDDVDAEAVIASAKRGGTDSADELLRKHAQDQQAKAQFLRTHLPPSPASHALAGFLTAASTLLLFRSRIPNRRSAVLALVAAPVLAPFLPTFERIRPHDLLPANF